MVQSTAWPKSASFRRKAQIDQALCESRPLVGSSRKRSNLGLATSSTPMVRSLRCSTFRPSPGMPTTALAYSSMPSILMTCSTNSNFSFLLTDLGRRSMALNRRLSLTVAVSRWRSGEMSVIRAMYKTGDRRKLAHPVAARSPSGAESRRQTACHSPAYRP